MPRSRNSTTYMVVGQARGGVSSTERVPGAALAPTRVAIQLRMVRNSAVATNFTSLRNIAPDRSFVNQVAEAEKQAHQAFLRSIQGLSALTNTFHTGSNRSLDSGRSSGSGGQSTFAGTRSVRSMRTQSYALLSPTPQTARAPTQRTAATTVPKQAQKLNELLVQLMSHEINRIVAWHNPANEAHLHLPGQEEREAPAPNTARLRQMVHVAWGVSPRLAFGLLRRYNNATVRGELTALVTAWPERVRDMPEAVEFLVTRENVESDAPVLRHLTYWAPASMPEILRLVSRCSGKYAGDRAKQMPGSLFRHPVVAFYVGQSLRCFPPEDIVFYLPQLLQALREDAHGVMTQFLFETSQQSVLVSHQLMWLLATESKVDEEEHPKKKKGASPEPISGHGFQVRAAFGGDWQRCCWC